MFVPSEIHLLHVCPATLQWNNRKLSVVYLCGVFAKFTIGIIVHACDQHHIVCFAFQISNVCIFEIIGIIRYVCAEHHIACLSTTESSVGQLWGHSVAAVLLSFQLPGKSCRTGLEKGEYGSRQTMTITW